jgi:hypothetical protein
VTALDSAVPDSDGAEWTADLNNSSDVDNHERYTSGWLDYATGLYHVPPAKNLHVQRRQEFTPRRNDVERDR